jgi:hypothetical protein
MRAFPLLLVAAVVIVPGKARAQDDDDEWLEHCRSQRWNGRRPTACEVQVKTIPARSMLTVRPGQNGAVHIEAYDGRQIEVHTRLQASAESKGAAQELLDDIQVDLGETITASAPASGRSSHWGVSFVIYVPRNSNVDVTTHNGPIAVENVVGRIELSAQNGPISLSGVGGNVHARAQNGPLHVRLTGTRWTGAGLDAETANGPIALEIPQEYNAALETGTINGPMETDFPLTVTLSGRNWKRLSTTLGSGGAPVRVVTTNGPVSLRRP